MSLFFPLLRLNIGPWSTGWSCSCDQLGRDTLWLEDSETRQGNNMLVLELEKSPVKQIGETKVELRGKDTVFPACLDLYICNIIQILRSKDLK